MSIRLRFRSVKHPFLTGTIIATAALAVGFATATFSVLDAVVLKAARFPASDALFRVRCNVASSSTAVPCPVGAWAAIAEGSTAVREAAYYGYGPSRLDAPGIEPQTLVTKRVSSSFFSTLGIPPKYGRWFLNSDNRGVGNNLVIISERTSRDRLGHFADVLGSTIVLDDKPYIISAIMPDDFTFPESNVGAWVLDPLTVERIENAGLYDSTMVIRTKPDVSIEQLNAQLDVVARRLTAQGLVSFEIVTLRDAILGSNARVVWSVFVAANILLLIITVNLANIAALRSLASYDERFIRVALGATPVRLFREYCIEYLPLAILTAVLATGVAVAVLQLFQALGGLNISRAELATIGVRVSLYAAGVTLLAGMSALVVSFWGTLNRQEISAVKSLSSARRVKSLHSASLSLQFCSGVLLAVIAVFALKTLIHVHHLPLGFDPNNLLAAELETAGTPTPQSATSVLTLLQHLRRLPGVEAVAVSSIAPLRGASVVPSIPVADQAGVWKASPAIQIRRVTTDYFKAIKTDILIGRSFSDQDLESSPCVAVVNQSFAKWLGGYESALGRVVSGNRRQGAQARPCSIIGIARDAREKSVHEEPGPQVYFSYLQQPERNWTLLIRGIDQLPHAASVRAAVAQHNPSAKIRSLLPIADYVHGATRRERLVSYEVLLFAVCGCAISLLGIIGLVEHFIRTRRSEIAVRLALGAERVAVIKMVTREYIGAAVIGLALGAILSQVSSNVLTSSEFFSLPLTRGDLLAGVGISASAIVAVIWSVTMIGRGEVADLFRAR